MQILHDGKAKVDGSNEVVIYNFKNKTFTSYLKNSLTKNDVRTINQGLSEISTNGDLFVEEQNFGRKEIFFYH